MYYVLVYPVLDSLLTSSFVSKLVIASIAVRLEFYLVFELRLIPSTNKEILLELLLGFRLVLG